MHFGGPTRIGPRNHNISWGSRSPTGRDSFGGCLAHWKELGISAAVYAAKGIIQSSIAARHAMRPFVKILWPLVYDGGCGCRTRYWKVKDSQLTAGNLQLTYCELRARANSVSYSEPHRNEWWLNFGYAAKASCCWVCQAMDSLIIAGVHGQALVYLHARSICPSVDGHIIRCVRLRCHYSTNQRPSASATLLISSHDCSL